MCHFFHPSSHFTSCGKSWSWIDLIQLNSVVKWGQRKDLTNGNIKSVTLMSAGTQRLCSLFLNKSALYTAPQAPANEWTKTQEHSSSSFPPSFTPRASWEKREGKKDTTKSRIMNWNREGHRLSALSLIREVKGSCKSEGAYLKRERERDCFLMGKRGRHGASVTGDGALYPAPGMHRSSQSKLRFIYSGRAGINTQTCLATKWRTEERLTWGLDSFPCIKKPSWRRVPELINSFGK